MKREANFQTFFNRYVREKKLAGVFELKQTTEDSIPFSDLQPHQREGLLAVEEGGFVWKLSDADPREKPFDMIATGLMSAYVAVKFPGKMITVIPIDDFLQEESVSKRKSLTLVRATIIASKVIHMP